MTIGTGCPLCSAKAAREIYRWARPSTVDPTGRPTESLYGRAGRMVRCDGCGLVRQDPQPVAPYEEASDDEYLAEEAGIRATARRTLDTIGRYVPAPGRLLDVGCGPGLLVDEASRAGWDAIGLELSSWAVEHARSRGRPVVQTTLEQYDEGRFDAAVLADVVEHLPDPLASMRRLRELINDGGVVFLCTPDAGSVAARVLRRRWWSVLPGHLYLFSRDTLVRLVREAEFEPLEIGTHPKTFSVSYYAGRLTGYSNAVSRAARGIVRPVRGRLISPDFRDRVALIARVTSQN